MGQGWCKGPLFALLALIIEAAFAGIYIGLIALYKHFAFGNPFGVGKGEVFPGAFTPYIILILGGLGVASGSGMVTTYFFEKERYDAGVVSLLGTLFFAAFWLFNTYEGWKYNLLNMK
jgi:hypothetical protein